MKLGFSLMESKPSSWKDKRTIKEKSSVPGGTLPSKGLGPTAWAPKRPDLRHNVASQSTCHDLSKGRSHCSRLPSEKTLYTRCSLSLQLATKLPRKVVGRSVPSPAPEHVTDCNTIEQSALTAGHFADFNSVNQSVIPLVGVRIIRHEHVDNTAHGCRHVLETRVAAGC